MAISAKARDLHGLPAPIKKWDARAAAVRFGAEIAAGEMTYGECYGLMMRVALRVFPKIDPYVIENRVHDLLVEAVAIADGTAAPAAVSPLAAACAAFDAMYAAAHNAGFSHDMIRDAIASRLRKAA